MNPMTIVLDILIWKRKVDLHMASQKEMNAQLQAELDQLKSANDENTAQAQRVVQLVSDLEGQVVVLQNAQTAQGGGVTSEQLSTLSGMISQLSGAAGSLAGVKGLDPTTVTQVDASGNSTGASVDSTSAGNTTSGGQSSQGSSQSSTSEGNGASTVDTSPATAVGTSNARDNLVDPNHSKTVSSSNPSDNPRNWNTADAAPDPTAGALSNAGGETTTDAAAAAQSSSPAPSGTAPVETTPGTNNT